MREKTKTMILEVFAGVAGIAAIVRIFKN